MRGTVISFTYDDFDGDDDKAPSGGAENVDFAVIKLKSKPKTPHGNYADITEALHKYEGECLLSFSVVAQPQPAKFVSGAQLEF